MMARGVIALLWLLHWLPLPLQAKLGRLFGRILWFVAPARRKIALRNIALCMPELPDKSARSLAKQHFGFVARSFLERGVLWFASAERLRRLITVEGAVDLADKSDQPVMWLVPHFVGLDVAGVAAMLYVNKPFASIYQSQSNKVVDAAMLRGRTRFGKTEIFPRSDSVKPLLRRIRQGMPFFNLPDMDFGARDAAFVPFFGVPCATLTAPSRIARAADMQVQPVIAHMKADGSGYVVRFAPPLADFPTEDVIADTTRINKIIEAEVLAQPAQYLWVHKRFKTRPDGAPSLYH